ncbi:MULTISPECIES: hypothetical protein [unclassified Enterococcus]|uniref:hypothetical protein n=1 Tax=unclassified Enterococcus TaxID=2608891 RepID=UPI003F2878CA
MDFSRLFPSNWFLTKDEINLKKLLHKFEKTAPFIREIGQPIPSFISQKDLQTLQSLGFIIIDRNQQNPSFLFTDKGIAHFANKKMQRRDTFLRSFILPIIVAFVTGSISALLTLWLSKP